MKDSTHITKRRRDAVDALFSEDGSLDEILIQRGIAPGVFLSWLDDPAFSLYLQKQVQARAQAAVLSACEPLSPAPECWDYRHVPPRPNFVICFILFLFCFLFFFFFNFFN